MKDGKLIRLGALLFSTLDLSLAYYDYHYGNSVYVPFLLAGACVILFVTLAGWRNFE